jgi:nucleoside-diphosphate-sugar epimerase
MATDRGEAGAPAGTDAREPETPRTPTIVVTGASGFIGRNFLAAAKRDYRIFALARRSQLEAGVPVHPNIHWIMVDIKDVARLEDGFREIRRRGGADFVLHLAGFYNFDRLRHPEYQLTNVEGTRNVLELASMLSLKRFVFSSSVTVTDFRSPGTVVSERSPTDATFPYALSKIAAEKMIRDYSAHFPCSVVRLAAVYSDWCEYGPLYMLLDNWLSARWCSRVLPGRGAAALPYAHVSYVVELFLKLFAISHRLDRYETYVAGPNGSTSVRELFELATTHRFGQARRPIFVPRLLSCIGLACKNTAGRIGFAHPRERLWMLRYTDKVLTIDPSRTEELVSVKQRRRYRLTRRLVFLIENSKNYPVEWHTRNAAAMIKAAERPALVISNAMRSRADEIVDRIYERISVREELVHYRKMEPDRLRWYILLIFRLLSHAVGTGDKMPLFKYGRYLARVRRMEGFDVSEITEALRSTGIETRRALLEDPALARLEAVIRNSINLTMEPMCDEVEDAYEESIETGAIHV